MSVRRVAFVLIIVLLSQSGPAAAICAVATVKPDFGGSANESEFQKFGDDIEDSAALFDLAGWLTPDARACTAGSARVCEAGFSASIDRPPATR